MFAIFRSLKLKTTGDIASADLHCRREGKQSDNIDPEKTPYNFDYRQHIPLEGEITLKEKINGYIERNGVIQPRKDSVKCLELLFSASPEFFQDLDRSNATKDKKFMAWLNATEHFVRKNFCPKGNEEGFIAMHIHLDETTPHAHAFVVPTHNKRLNAKEYLGSPAKLRALQDEYSNILKIAGIQELKRGNPVETTRAKHTKLKEFYSKLDELDGILSEEVKKQIQEKLKAELKPGRKL